jgi:hypothetical protein
MLRKWGEGEAEIRLLHLVIKPVLEKFQVVKNESVVKS